MHRRRRQGSAGRKRETAYPIEMRRRSESRPVPNGGDIRQRWRFLPNGSGFFQVRNRVMKTRRISQYNSTTRAARVNTPELHNQVGEFDLENFDAEEKKAGELLGIRPPT